MQREIDRSGLRVKAIGLGAMPLSIAGRPGPAEAFRVIEAFVDAGGDFIDTANVYCLDDGDIGHNERLIHDALTRLGRRDQVLVATKGGLRRPRGEWTVDGSPKWLRASCEQSLAALGTEVITLYQLHAVDPAVGFRETLGALIALQAEGKIRHIGLSNVDPGQLETALAHTAIASVQNRCNPFSQGDFKNGLVDLCKARGVTYIAYSPVGGHFGHQRLEADPLLARLAAKYACSPQCIALSWLLHKGDHILPIPGASKPASILDSLKAMDLVLEASDIEAIDRLPRG